jgi:hypothetical protein
MKVFKILALIILTACNVDLSSKSISKDCSMNGQKVDCKTFSPISSQNKSSIEAEISASAEISDSEIEILENAEDIKEKDGTECSISVYAGDILKIRYSAGMLFLKYNDIEEEAVFHSTKIQNEWKMELIDKDLKIVTTISFKEGFFRSTMSCSEI